MDLQLNGLTAVVTGGSRGIGGAIVRTLAAEGCRVAFCSRTAADVEAQKQRLLALPGVSDEHVIAAVLDATDKAAFAGWLATLPQLDILVANVNALTDESPQGMAVELATTLGCIEAALPLLRRSKHAAITYIGSMAASTATPDNKAYGAVKSALAHTMKSLSRELAGDGIRVNTVSPGFTFAEDGFWNRVKAQAPQLVEQYAKQSPMGRMAEAEEIARVVAFVSSPAASYVAGANWLVDGGTTAHLQV